MDAPLEKVHLNGADFNGTDDRDIALPAGDT